jgi:predicted N-acyltransferase
VADSLRIHEGLEEIDGREWDALAGANPTLAYAFLDSLHKTGCAGARSGWKPQYLVLTRGLELAGAVPLYL